jgi:hypothetical protein
VKQDFQEFICSLDFLFLLCQDKRKNRIFIYSLPAEARRTKAGLACPFGELEFIPMNIGASLKPVPIFIGIKRKEVKTLFRISLFHIENLRNEMPACRSGRLNSKSC